MSDFMFKIDNNWTLFLDRDGVINKRPPGDYIKTWKDFAFLPGVKEAMKILAGTFSRIIVVTNQQGVGKGLMTEDKLQYIHRKMTDAITESGGRIDAVYYCPKLATDTNNCRKPGIYMAEQAKKDFPEIDFQKSIMAGDTLSDMDFGKLAGMKTVYINTDNAVYHSITSDYSFHNLLAFAQAIM